MDKGVNGGMGGGIERQMEEWVDDEWMVGWRNRWRKCLVDITLYYITFSENTMCNNSF